MSTNDKEIQDIVEQFRQLQLQQTALVACAVARLQQLDGNKPRAQRQDGNTREDREFAVGDRVCIKNPRPFQPSRGTIQKIGQARITIKGRDGKTIIHRTPKNLTLDDESR
jgi:hypothetical protein